MEFDRFNFPDAPSPTNYDRERVLVARRLRMERRRRRARRLLKLIRLLSGGRRG